MVEKLSELGGATQGVVLVGKILGNFGSEFLGNLDSPSGHWFLWTVKSAVYIEVIWRCVQNL